MDQFFSYVDTALRIIHINQTIFDDNAEELKKLNKALQEQETAAEYHHYWQSLFYPFLFYINFLECKTIIDLKNSLRAR